MQRGVTTHWKKEAAGGTVRGISGSMTEQCIGGEGADLNRRRDETAATVLGSAGIDRPAATRRNHARRCAGLGERPARFAGVRPGAIDTKVARALTIVVARGGIAALLGTAIAVLLAGLGHRLSQAREIVALQDTL